MYIARPYFNGVDQNPVDQFNHRGIDIIRFHLSFIASFYHLHLIDRSRDEGVEIADIDHIRIIEFLKGAHITVVQGVIPGINRDRALPIEAPSAAIVFLNAVDHIVI